MLSCRSKKSLNELFRHLSKPTPDRWDDSLAVGTDHQNPARLFSHTQMELGIILHQRRHAKLTLFPDDRDDSVNRFVSWFRSSGLRAGRSEACFSLERGRSTMLEIINDSAFRFKTAWKWKCTAGLASTKSAANTNFTPIRFGL